MAKSTKDLIKSSTKELTKLRALLQAFGPDLITFHGASQALKTHKDKRPDDLQLLQAMTDFDEARAGMMRHKKPMAAQVELLQKTVEALDEKQKKKELKQEFKKVDKIEAHLKNVNKALGEWTTCYNVFRTTSASAEVQLGG